MDVKEKLDGKWKGKLEANFEEKLEGKFSMVLENPGKPGKSQFCNQETLGNPKFWEKKQEKIG